MKLTIQHKDTKIIVEEAETSSDDKLTNMKFNDQNKYLQETIVVICEQIQKLQNHNNK